MDGLEKFMTSSITRYVGIFTAYIVYLLVGSSIFDAIEMPAVHERERRLEEEKNNFLQDYPNVDKDALNAYVSEVFGIYGHNNVTRPNFATWLFFSSTLLTTIGYGQVPPLSYGSKAFAICYCTLGVPFTLVLLKAITEKLMEWTSHFLEYLNTKLGHLYRPIHIRTLHAALITATCVLFVFFLPAAVFSMMEPEWSFLDSFYYSYMSVTTIGVVDVLPASRIQNPEKEAFYKIAVLIYLFFGLCFTLLCLSIINEIPQINFLLQFLHPSHGSRQQQQRKRESQQPTEKTNLVVTKTIHKNKYGDGRGGGGGHGFDENSNFSRNTSISFSSEDEDK
ncbi:potassium channel subfamily K member 6-like [Paramacrobiotus metropolitanus]|uniref:potassium channel subfamily K member 6-like n=1 Tax=Paramacrobiotus metropolitanus TaxID=2943436 RepID=UPI00244629AF|nr:potassium channel subfamily K member 6-like [Paramacrobiotus metropolitanus]